MAEQLKGEDSNDLGKLETRPGVSGSGAHYGLSGPSDGK